MIAAAGFLAQELVDGGNHGKTSVLEFLGLKESELFRVFGLESERVEADVTGDVVGTEKSGLVDRDVLGLNPSDGGTLLLTGANGNGQEQPERNRNLGKVGDGRSRNLGIEEEGASFDGFTSEETDGGEHGNTSVGEFGLTVSLEGVFIGLFSESERIEESDGFEGTDHGVDERSNLGSRGSLLGERGESSGRTGSGDKGGGNELHFENMFLCVCL